MGTRGLLGLIIAAQRHAAYNHYDSYPSGLGQDIVKFLAGLKPEDHDNMAKLVKEIEWVDFSSSPAKELQEKYSTLGFSDLSVSRQSLEDWYCLLHKTQGAAALPAIQSGQLKHLVESVDFLTDGLFCEWAYFIDFENKTLETWSYGHKLDSVTFERLAEEGKDYMIRMESDEHEGEGNTLGSDKVFGGGGADNA